jgi:hypothetical protein
VCGAEFPRDKKMRSGARKTAKNFQGEGKSEELKKMSLWVFVLVALVALPVYLTGEPAEEVVEHLPGVAESFIESYEEMTQPLWMKRGEEQRRGARH